MKRVDLIEKVVREDVESYPFSLYEMKDGKVGFSDYYSMTIETIDIPKEEISNLVIGDYETNGSCDLDFRVIKEGQDFTRDLVKSVDLAESKDDIKSLLFGLFTIDGDFYLDLEGKDEKIGLLLSVNGIPITDEQFSNGKLRFCYGDKGISVYLVD